MNNQEYEQNKRECWLIYAGAFDIKDEIPNEAFNWVFDRAFALGKQAETITQEDIEKAAKEYSDRLGKSRDVTWNDAEYGFIAGANFALGKQKKEADTVIQGWVARDEDGRIYLYEDEPKRENGKPYGKPSEWVSENIMTKLSVASFPDLTWDSDPEQVELIIKRKKNG